MRGLAYVRGLAVFLDVLGHFGTRQLYSVGVRDLPVHRTVSISVPARRPRASGHIPGQLLPVPARAPLVVSCVQCACIYT